MGTFATAFLSRPLGAAVFGYYGDRLGRKKTLVATLLIMAVSTVSVGLVPSTASDRDGRAADPDRAAAAAGVCRGRRMGRVGVAERRVRTAGRRGLYGMFTLLGGGVAGVMSSLTFLGVNVTIGEYSPEFLEWGWRVPFLISAALIALALYVRLNIDETPVFAEEKARNLVPKAPLAEVLRLQRREILLAAGSVVGGMASSTWATPISRCTPTPTWAIRVASSGRSGCSAGLASIAVGVVLGHPVRPSGAPANDAGGLGESACRGRLG